MNSTTTSKRKQIIIWLVWLLVVFVSLVIEMGVLPTMPSEPPVSGLTLDSRQEERKKHKKRPYCCLDDVARSSVVLMGPLNVRRMAHPKRQRGEQAR